MTILVANKTSAYNEIHHQTTQLLSYISDNYRTKYPYALLQQWLSPYTISGQLLWSKMCCYKR
ncbi:hypothetical protein [Paraglaciecola sp.]|uniref:hypothetical protein n=1 Tax=Paraglaciecola sp. TaxID=1920173 RepID=UPI0030F4AD10